MLLLVVLVPGVAWAVFGRGVRASEVEAEAPATGATRTPPSALALHTYTHGADAGLIAREERVGGVTGAVMVRVAVLVEPLREAVTVGV